VGAPSTPGSLAYPSASSVNGVALMRTRSVSSITATTCGSAATSMPTKQDARVKILSFRKNSGQTAAMAAGFEYATGDLIVSMVDGDLQNDPVDIPRLLSKLREGFDVVCGWRKSRQDKFWTRCVPSAAANWIIGRVTGVRIHDNGCWLKVYRASVIKSIALYGEMHHFIPAMTTLAGARIAEIVVNHHPRRFGKIKYGIGRTWRVLLDIITAKLITGFASRPALWFGLPSFSIFGLGLSALLTPSFRLVK
jgi:glycosyltransferase involved in cell wall biosynthesis